MWAVKQQRWNKNRFCEARPPVDWPPLTIRERERESTKDCWESESLRKRLGQNSSMCAALLLFISSTFQSLCYFTFICLLQWILKPFNFCLLYPNWIPGLFTKWTSTWDEPFTQRCIQFFVFIYLQISETDVVSLPPTHVCLVLFFLLLNEFLFGWKYTKKSHFSQFKVSWCSAKGFSRFRDMKVLSRGYCLSVFSCF